jgi:predicted nucleic acid-binding protein
MTQVFAINDYTPIKNERYFIDTNVWYWTTYIPGKDMSLINQPQKYQVTDYPAFIQKAIDDGAILCHCPMTFAELAYLIEKTEWEIFKKNKNDEFIDKKEFRKNRESRKAVLKEIDMAWNTINSMSNCIDTNMNMDFVSSSKNILEQSNVDPFDAFYVQLMNKNKIDFVVTDDHDFCSTKHIVVTSNRKAFK